MKDGISGAFNFSSSEINNYLTDTTMQIWGGDVTNLIGMDFRADITAELVPKPNSMFLLATGLLFGLIWWRYPTAQASRPDQLFVTQKIIELHSSGSEALFFK